MTSSRSRRNKSKQLQLASPKPTTRPLRRSGRHIYVIAGTVLLLAGAAGVYFYPRQAADPTLPDIPTVNLDGADPEIVKVIRAAGDSVAQNPRLAAAWGQLGMVLHAHGFSDAAQQCYEAATSLEPKNPLWSYLRGYLHHNGPGGLEAALPHFQLAARRSPAGSIAHLRLADTLLELGHLDEAEAAYRKVLAVYDQDPLAGLGLAKLAVARQHYRESLEYLRPIADSPLVVNQACAMRANVYDRLGDRAAADAERQQLAELPEDGLRSDDPIVRVLQLEVGLHVQLANAEKLLRQNRLDEMKLMVEDATHRYPDSFEAWSALGNACGETGDPVGAERAIKKSVELAPKNADAWLSLGNIYLWQQRYQEAVAALQKSIALNPKSGSTFFALGECRQGLGDSAGAAEAYRESLRYSPHHPLARQRLETLEQQP